jgi:hypothetical protein
VVTEAKFDSLEIPFKVGKDGTVKEQCHKWDWGFDKERESDVVPMSYGELARIIAGAHRITEYWPEITSRGLQWTNLSADIGMIGAFGADFILCDGTSYSDAPGAGVLGLRPVLSLGNAKAVGIGRRYSNNFNAKGGAEKVPTDIVESVMVVEGYQGVTGGGAQLERKYIPAGMSMGESDIQILTAEGSKDDEIIVETLQHYSQQQTKYNVPYYTDIIGAPPDLAVQTDWDPWAKGLTQVDVRAAWITAMNGQMVLTEASRFITRIGGGLFYHRFVVRMSRPKHYELYNEHGTFRQNVPFEGHVEFDGNISTTVTSAAIETIVQSAPPIILTGSAAVDQALTTDLKVVAQDQAEGG